MKPEELIPEDSGTIKSWMEEGKPVKRTFDNRRQGQFDIIGWLIRQNEYAKFSEKNRLAINVKAGEIYEVDFGINVHAEFSYRHYALVLADSHESNPLVLVCPLKSNNKGAHPASDINLGIIEALDSDHESLAVVNQIRTIDKLRIFKKSLINKPSERNGCLNDANPINECDDNQVYRLEPSKFKKVLWGTLNYIEYGYISQK